MMDLAYEQGIWKGGTGELNNNVSCDPSMEDIVFSMQSTLLGSGSPPPLVISPDERPPLCSSPIDKVGLGLHMDSSITLNTDPNQSFEDVFDDTLTLDDIAIPSANSKERNCEGTGCQGSQHPSDGQVGSEKRKSSGVAMCLLRPTPSASPGHGVCINETLIKVRNTLKDFPSL